MNKKSNVLIKSAFIITAGNFAAKLIGAIYRIPLTNILGSSGIGLYQMIFPFYCILLDLSGNGIPSGLSKIVSENLSDGNGIIALRIFRSAKMLMLIAGIACVAVMAALSYPVSLMQGNSQAFTGYLLLCPSVLLVSLISCYRGYFQGRSQMAPTAVSVITEQIVKAAVGLMLAYLLSYNVVFAVGGAAFAITVSEAVTLAVIAFIFYKKFGKSYRVQTADYSRADFIADSKVIVKTALPISLAAVILPLSQIIDSVIIINFLSRYTQNSTSLYGIYSGAVLTLINLPVSLCYGISVAVIPLTAAGKDNVKKACLITLGLSAACAVGIYVFSETITSFLFPSFGKEESAICVQLIKITAAAPVLLSLTQTLNAYFIGKGKQSVTLIAISFGVFFKTVIQLLLVPMPEYNIFGAGVALVSCYLVAATFDLMYYIREKRLNARTRRAAVGYAD